ncbi:PBP1A family penicillin-binding protein [Defluviimonas sp. D31]|uniref:transglycosylase domain-containing protein n=1 Tax=Defluviimonas sp. D31 TaxID=3083253 RepID=UPI00296EB9A7|nr:PBP1A family penicillin-binding protein [Defluviimonas sp. D31]MDW4551302.1 PBP1A family penicillin-binding protein [Defluviimonas sp. D31]
MSRSGGKKPPMVAERRYSQGAAPKSKPARKPARKPKAARPRRAARGSSWPVRLVTGLAGLIWRVVWGIGWRVGAVVAILVGLATLYFYAQLPPLEQLIDARTRGSVTMLDRDGKVFAWRGETFGGTITADTVSPHLKNAIVATEDKRFYRHLGVSPRGIASAIRINLAEGRGPLEGNGGSTITQQVAKLLCLGVAYDPATWKSESDYEADCRRGSLVRKIKEVPYSLALEAKYGKDDVLTLYINRAYLGAGARGFEAASQRYFGKSANEVNPSEAAMLAGLLKAPSYYAPTNDLGRAQERAALILGLMHDQGYITDTQYAEAQATPARLSQAAEARAGGYFADWVMESGPGFLTQDTTEDVIVRTTLDQRMQTAAEDALAFVFDTKVKEGSQAQAAIVVMSADGAVRAMVGGRKTKVNGAFNRAIQAKRQVGSTFKPFVYAAALDMGYTMNSIVEDAPITLHVKGSGEWSPKNYTPDFRGPITLTDALANSINTATVRVSQWVGLEAVRQVAEYFGLASDLAAGPAVALGASESTLLEMTGAYAGILNGGSSVRPYGLTELRIQGDDTALMGQEGGMGERVISEEAARQLTYMMTQVIERGTGGRARLPDRDAAGKTGTTSDYRDAWFIGFTADYVAGVWMGNDDNSPLTGVTGGGLPAEIWHEVMLRIHEGLPPGALPMIRPEQLPPPAWSGQTQQSGGFAQQGQQPRQDPVENVIRDVLGAILGGGRN